MPKPIRWGDDTVRWREPTLGVLQIWIRASNHYLLSMAESDITLTFPADGDRRPSTPVLTKILADSVRGVDTALSTQISESKDWRKEYVDLFGQATIAAATSSDASIEIARSGLESMQSTLVLARDAEHPNADNEVRLNKSKLKPTRALKSEQIVGTAAPETELRVPYKGKQLSGSQLVDQLGDWVERQIVEPSFAAAIAQVVRNPEWLSMPGKRMAMIGAGSEMGPLEPLLRWGVNVLAIDLPRDVVWERIRAKVQRSAGTVTAADDSDGTLGIDLRSHAGDALGWLSDAGEGADLVIGMYAYADSAAHVQVTAAADLVIQRMLINRPDTALSWLATPTDAYLVPAEVVEVGRQAWEDRNWVRHLQKPVNLATKGMFFEPSYSKVAADGRGLADILVPQQGPNYALAKRLQRWRGVLSESEGHRVSFNVAPATWTHSVTKNQMLAAAYAGAGSFGVAIFEPETARSLMAALLVHDLYTDAPVRKHPEDLFSDQAAHGGLWRVGYEPRTALPFAAIGGLPLLGIRNAKRRLFG